MADEILPAGIGDLISGEEMASEFLLLLADRDNSILTHPALFHATGRTGGRMSNVIRVAHVGLMGYDTLAATTPGSEVGNTAFTDDSTDVTVVSRAKVYSVDDFARFISGGVLDPQMFALDAVTSVAQDLIGLIANITDDFSATAGTTTVDATWNDIVDAKTLLGIAKATGPMVGVVHPRQWGDLELDALSLGVLPAQSLGGVINQGLDSFVGRWLGIDFFRHSSVPTANGGADRAGGIWTRGGIAWADAILDAEPDPNIIDMGRARLERARHGTFLETSWVVSTQVGVAQAIDAAGVSLITDA